MPTINQLICHGRESKWHTQRTQAGCLSCNLN
jgi:hypothetical protein